MAEGDTTTNQPQGVTPSTGPQAPQAQAPVTPSAVTPQAGQNPPAGQAAVQQAQQAAEQLSGGLKQGIAKLQQTGVAGVLKTAANQPPVTMEEKLWAGLSYIPLVALISLIIKPDSAYVKLHGKQGLLIFVLFFMCLFVYLVPFIGPLFAGLAQLALFVTGLFSMYQAFIGNWWKIPVLGDMSDIIPVNLFTSVTTEAISGQQPPQGAGSENSQQSSVPAPGSGQQPPQAGTPPAGQ